MNIVATAVNLATMQNQTSVSSRVNEMALDEIKSQGQQIVNLISEVSSGSQAAKASGSVGSVIDISA